MNVPQQKILFCLLPDLSVIRVHWNVQHSFRPVLLRLPQQCGTLKTPAVLQKVRDLQYSLCIVCWIVFRTDMSPLWGFRCFWWSRLRWSQMCELLVLVVKVYLANDTSNDWHFLLCDCCPHQTNQSGVGWNDYFFIHCVPQEVASDWIIAVSIAPSFQMPTPK